MGPEETAAVYADIATWAYLEEFAQLKDADLDNHIEEAAPKSGAMTIQKQFEAAVKVIQGLPKNGPYQPSHAMMLRFYSLYKQATIGKCNISKPSFWDVVNKAKYEAWNGLGSMSKEEAMQAYVDELKKIVETMSFSTDVSTFMATMGSFYEYIADDIDLSKMSPSPEAASGDAQSKYEGKPNLKELMSGKADAANGDSLSDKTEEDEEKSDDRSDNDDDNDCSPRTNQSELSAAVSENPDASGNQRLSESDDEDAEEDFHDSLPPEQFPRQIEQQSSTRASLHHTVQLLNKDLEHISTRLRNLEDLYFRSKDGGKTSWPLGEVSGSTVLFIVLWPFVAQGLMSVLARRS